MTTPEEIAKRAAELAARAEELARHVHDTAAADEQLRRLEAELAELEAEQARLDDGMPRSDAPEDISDDDDGGAGWVSDLARHLEELGERVADTIDRTVSDVLDGSAWSEGLEQRQPVPGPIPVRIVSRIGSVDVRPGEADEVVVRARQHARGDAQTPVDVDVSDGEVRVSVRGHRRWFARHRTHLDVRVPPGAPVLAFIGGGGIRVDDVNGPVTAQTGGGSIRIGRATDVTATTGGGGIRISAMDGVLSARTGGGGVSVEGRLRGESSIVTGGGGIQVTLDRSNELEIAANGTHARSEIPGITTTRGRASGRIGTGADGRLTARTGGGAVVLRLSEE